MAWTSPLSSWPETWIGVFGAIFRTCSTVPVSSPLVPPAMKARTNPECLVAFSSTDLGSGMCLATWSAVNSSCRPSSSPEELTANSTVSAPVACGAPPGVERIFGYHQKNNDTKSTAPELAGADMFCSCPRDAHEETLRYAGGGAD